MSKSRRVHNREESDLLERKNLCRHHPYLMNGEDLQTVILSFWFKGVIKTFELYPWASPSAISLILYTMPRRMEGAACHRMWVTCLFRLQHRVLPALVFAPVGRGLGPETGSTLMIQSQRSESVRSMCDYLETRTVSEPAEKRSNKFHVHNPRI